MKLAFALATSLFIATAAPSALAQAAHGGDPQKASTAKEMKSHDKKDMKKCEKMHRNAMKDMDMKGMDMKGMDMEHMDMSKMDMPGCKSMMKDKNAQGKGGASAASGTHHAMAVVREIGNGKVTLEHDAIKSLGWPAMTMAFSVKDKAVQEKLVTGKKVEVDFRKEGTSYVITAVK